MISFNNESKFIYLPNLISPEVNYFEREYSEAEIDKVAISPDNKIAVIVVLTNDDEGFIEIIDLETKQVRFVTTIEQLLDQLKLRSFDIESINISPDGSIVVFSTRNESEGFCIWNLRENKIIEKSITTLDIRKLKLPGSIFHLGTKYFIVRIILFSRNGLLMVKY